MSLKCPYCDFETNEPHLLEKHLSENHFMTVADMLERESRSTDEGFCWRCSKFLPPLQLLSSDLTFYLPCWNCIGKKKYEKTQAIGSIQNAIHEYYAWLRDDRYFQMFLVDDIYIRTTLSHEFSEFRKVLKILQPRDRNKLWLLDYIPGYPKTICEENVNGLKIVSIDEQFKYTSDRNTLIVKDFQVVFPEIIPYDPRHHSRYNIFNTSDARKTKRLRLSSPNGKSDRCVKFFNSLEDIQVKSLFQITRFSTGDPISPSEICHADLTILKLILMRNKTFMKLLIEFLEEISRCVGTFRDGVFLKNTINLDPSSSLKVSVTWTPEYKEDYINISIL